MSELPRQYKEVQMVPQVTKVIQTWKKGKDWTILYITNKKQKD